MLRKSTIGAIVLLTLAVMTSPAQVIRKLAIEFEIRCSGAMAVVSSTHLAFRRKSTIDAWLISQMDSVLTNGFRVFRRSFELQDDDRGKALIIYLSLTSTNQVFLLPAPPKAGDWTSWRYPDYLETNAVSNIRYGYVPADRTTNVPANSFQMRYRIK